jgi:hypothetical protein
MSKTTRMIRTIVPTPMYMTFPLVAVNAGAQIRPANRPSHCPQSARPNQPARPWLAMTRSEMKGPHDSHQGQSSSYSLESSSLPPRGQNVRFCCHARAACSDGDAGVVACADAPTATSAQRRAGNFAPGPPDLKAVI